jgi:hypothetical protein
MTFCLGLVLLLGVVAFTWLITTVHDWLQLRSTTDPEREEWALRLVQSGFVRKAR